MLGVDVLVLLQSNHSLCYKSAACLDQCQMFSKILVHHKECAKGIATYSDFTTHYAYRLQVVTSNEKVC